MRRLALLSFALTALSSTISPAGAQYVGWAYYPPPYYYAVPYGYYPPPYAEPPPPPYWRTPRVDMPERRWHRARPVHRIRVIKHRAVRHATPRGLVNPLLGPLPAR